MADAITTPATADQAPIEISRVLADTFELIGSRTGAVLVVALITVLPTRLAALAVASYGFAPGTVHSHWAIIGTVIALMAVAGALMAMFGQGALIGTAIAQQQDRPSHVVDGIADALKRLPILFVVTLLYMLGILFGALFLIVPGVIAAMMWSVTGPVAVAERTGIIATFRRSGELTHNSLWRIFLLMVVSGLITGILSWIAGRLGLLFLDTSASDLTYDIHPAFFLFQSLIETLTAAFDLPLACALYLVLIEREGGGPVADRLTAIFE